VRREHDRPPTLGVLANRAPESATRLHVHSRGRFIEHEQPRIGEQRHREAEALLLAAGAFSDAPIGDGRDPGAIEDLVHRLRVGVQGCGVRDGFLDGEVLEQPTVLHDGRHVAPGYRVFRRRAVQANGSGIGLREAEQHVDGRRLPGTVGAEEGDDLTRLDLEGQVVDGGDGPEPLRQTAQVYSEHVVSWGWWVS
jgi:hypothetical protein